MGIDLLDAEPTVADLDEAVTLSGNHDEWMREIMFDLTGDDAPLDEDEDNQDAGDEDDDLTAAQWFANVLAVVAQDEEDEESILVDSPKVRDPKACRAWARANGYEVGARGVIAQNIWDGYLAS